MLGRTPDPLLKRWHRCRQWEERQMPCPFRHEGEPERTRDPRSPFDWVKDWYLRDVNISRRVGWSGPAHDAFTYPFRELDRRLQPIFPMDKLDGMDAGQRFEAILRAFEEQTPPAVYAPADAKGDTGGKGRGRPLERPHEAYWPPVADRTFPGLYPPRDPLGEGGDQRAYRMYWGEAALAETVKPITQGVQNPMPAGTPSGFPTDAGKGTPFNRGGYGGVHTMAETFSEMRDLITPAFRQADPSL